MERPCRKSESWPGCSSKPGWGFRLGCNPDRSSHSQASSQGARIPPQGRVQLERSSYDNIIVRTAKGQTSAGLVLRGPLAEGAHRWPGHWCRASGKPGEMPAPTLAVSARHSTPLRAPGGSALACRALGSGPSSLLDGDVPRVLLPSPRAAQTLAAAENLPSALGGHITVIGED